MSKRIREREAMVQRIQLAQSIVEDIAAADADRKRSVEFLSDPSTLAFIRSMNKEQPVQDAAPLTVVLATAVVSLTIFGSMLAGSIPVRAKQTPMLAAVSIAPERSPVVCVCDKMLRPICHVGDGVMQILPGDMCSEKNPGDDPLE